MSSSRRFDTLALLAILSIACSYVVGVLWAQARVGDVQLPVHPPHGLSTAEDLFRLLPSNDLYASHYPNVIYGLQSIRQGHGLLWNSLQNCGEPFLASTLVALLYPLHLLFLILPIDTGLFVITALHLTIAGVGTYFLCRQYGLGRLASLCGGIGFEISGQVIGLAADLPTSVLGVYVWIPIAMLRCERILQSPTAGASIALGVTLTLQLLAGHVQILFFTYQLLGLRIVWELATTRLTRPTRTFWALLAALVFPIFLGAAQLLPMAEFAGQSIRNATLGETEISPFGYWSWAEFRSGPRGAWRIGCVAVLAMIPAALAALAFVLPRRRRLPAFYLLVAALYLALVFENPVFALYRSLPLGALFREPVRFLWMTNFAIGLLGAFGAEALCHAAEQSEERRVVIVLVPLFAGGALYLLIPSSIDPLQWGLLGALVVVSVLVVYLHTRLPLAGVAAAVLLTANLFLVNSRPWLGFFKAGSVLYKYADAFAFLKKRMTLQDRLHQYAKGSGYAMMPKSASVFGVPSISDYEPQTSRRYAELYVRLMDDVPMGSILQHIFRLNNVPRNLQLFNLTATRYVMLEKGGQAIDALVGRPLKLIWNDPKVAIYENPDALPRAFYVPTAEILPDPSAVLARLASADHDPRQVALLEAPPADGFVGVNPTGRAQVTFVSDRSEEVVINVLATSPGFLFLADQYYPGWQASVNGAATPIMRANYAFRLIRVPEGESRVILRYRPASFGLGALISLGTLAGLAIYLLARMRRASRGGGQVRGDSHTMTTARIR